MKRKIAVAFLLMIMLLTNTALAKFSDDYKKQYPKNVKTTVKQDTSGKHVTTTYYSLFTSKNPKGLSVVLIEDGNVRLCALYFGRTPDRWKFYDKLIWGDGEKSHDILPAIKPTREVHRGYVLEQLSMFVDPSELKKAIILSAHSERGGNETILNESSKDWKEWKAAIEAAEKIIAEK